MIRLSEELHGLVHGCLGASGGSREVAAAITTVGGLQQPVPAKGEPPQQPTQPADQIRHNGEVQYHQHQFSSSRKTLMWCSSMRHWHWQTSSEG
ncbi:hypothetical protein E2C01_045004 [Portunus trituberculatus]|uniref:Uncharacterized protein n=1 Tax=Portunus trituberculatus TaxID=210409 RepID=A0A5B7G3V9_PORTR|nr:hypothetical protein [Portunus trituberculatus]